METLHPPIFGNFAPSTRSFHTRVEQYLHVEDVAVVMTIVPDRRVGLTRACRSLVTSLDARGTHRLCSREGAIASIPK